MKCTWCQTCTAVRVHHAPTGTDGYEPKPLNDEDDFVEQIDSQDALHCIKMIDSDLSNLEITGNTSTVQRHKSRRRSPIGHFGKMPILGPALILEELFDHFEAEEVIVVA